METYKKFNGLSMRGCPVSLYWESMNKYKRWGLLYCVIYFFKPRSLSLAVSRTSLFLQTAKRR